MKTFVVLGMHRSATSLAAQGAAKAGVHMGSVLLGEDESNEYGHFEDVDFININDQILKLAGGSWDNPPPESKIIEVGKADEAGIRDFIRVKEKEPFWGWKDPRTVLTIRCYMPFLKNPHFITCYRKPQDVAGSLYKRDEMPIDKGLSLAKEYNQRMFSFLKEFVEC